MNTETFGNQWFSVSFHWQDGMLVGTTLHPALVPATAPCTPFGPSLKSLIADFDRLTNDVWPDLPIDMRHLSPFTRTVLEYLRTDVPRGSWLSYGDLAKACGSPRGARPVGTIMATNPWALIIPCHRVLASGGGIGGFGPGIALKRTLLRLEGVSQ